jgi:hypothetical protein
MSKNIQVRTHQKLHDTFSSWIPAGAPPQCLVCIGITPHDEFSCYGSSHVPQFLWLVVVHLSHMVGRQKQQ